MVPAVLGLDIGGANLKAAHSSGSACLQPFALWKDPGNLPLALRQLTRKLPPYDFLAVTMTGELCDCFESKRQGVETILAAVQTLDRSGAVQIWGIDGRFVGLERARADPLSVAAANWLALGVFAGRFAPAGPALLMDIGSTTTDLVPLYDGTPVPRGQRDEERLRSHELVYTGVRRTPLCALLGSAGAAELFATTLDVYIVLGDLPEIGTDRNTADGRPATRAAAHARLARMRCADAESCSEEETRKLALQMRNRQLRLLRRAVEAVSSSLPAPPATVITAGSGEFLAARIVPSRPGRVIRRISLAEKLGPAISHAACAYALAILTAERIEYGESE